VASAAAPPAPTPLRGEASVVVNRAEGGANRRLVLRLPGWPGFLPGQFVMLSPGALPARERSDPLLPRPMAVYRGGAGPDEFEVLYKLVGRGTHLLGEAQPGQRVGVVGPLGRGFAPPARGVRTLLVAGGTGIASVYELAVRSRDAADVAVLLGARSTSDLMGVDDFEALGIPVHVATEDGSRGRRGLVTALLEEALADGRPTAVVACGPTPMMRACADLAAAVDAPCTVSLENHMACGFGVCLGCAAPLRDEGYALVCRDGPMFPASALDWDRLP
jgi:dihydroorotate dehydrogenase electron transfer subunit